MKYLKLYENINKKFWSINFQDPYMVYKASKILKKGINFGQRIKALINFQENNPNEKRLLYITTCDNNYRWNSFSDSEFKERRHLYAGEIELTPEEKELADIEIAVNKYNL